ncbi:MAG: hypothetical protein LBJ96_01410, partial [Holosporaceae bacterium]|nr:hypothetical protein [Holosporaceae bacterium]
GEIQQNQSIFPQIIAKQDGSLIADAKTPIFKCEDLLGIELLKPLVEDESEEPDIETMGGLIILLAGRMPTRGETFVHPSGIEFDVIEADPRRVRRILIRKTTEPAKE